MCPFKTVSIIKYNLPCDFEGKNILLHNLVDWIIYLMGHVTELLIIALKQC